jgi:hypothetical protein
VSWVMEWNDEMRRTKTYLTRMTRKEPYEKS